MTYKYFIDQYLEKGLLKRQKPDFRAIERLLIRAHKDLKAAKANLNIDEGIAFTVAYLAMLHTGKALMLLKGFRSSDGYQHKTVVEFMFHVLGEECKTIVERFDKMRRKRNIFTYEVSISISKTEANNSIQSATKFVNLVEDIIKKNNPQFKFQF